MYGVKTFQRGVLRLREGKFAPSLEKNIFLVREKVFHRYADF